MLGLAWLWLALTVQVLRRKHAQHRLRPCCTWYGEPLEVLESDVCRLLPFLRKCCPPPDVHHRKPGLHHLLHEHVTEESRVPRLQYSLGTATLAIPVPLAPPGLTMSSRAAPNPLAVGCAHEVVARDPVPTSTCQGTGEKVPQPACSACPKPASRPGGPPAVHAPTANPIELISQMFCVTTTPLGRKCFRADSRYPV